MRSPKLLYEVLKSKNVVCMPNYNIINSYLPFSFFHFSMTTLLQLGVSIETAKYKIHVSKSKLAVKNVTGGASTEKEVQLDGCYDGLSDYECQPCPRAIPPGTSLRGLGRGDEETDDTSDYYELTIFFQKILEILTGTRYGC